MFIHVHKCAGTAVSKSFLYSEGLEPSPWTFIDENPETLAIMDANGKLMNSDFSNADHFRAIDMQALLGKKEYGTYYKFAVSRNPWDRLKSWYYFLRQNTEKKQNRIVTQMTMEDFIKYNVDHFYLPQHEWLSDPDGNIIVDEIIKLDDLAGRWDNLLQERIGKTIKLDFINASSNTTAPQKNPFENVRKETLEKFRDAYIKDFEILGYDTALPQHRDQKEEYQKCEQIWSAERSGNRDIEGLCKTHGVKKNIYDLYRETNSSDFYIKYLGTKLTASMTESARNHSALRKRMTENDRLSESVKKWSSEVQEAKKNAAEISAKLRKSEHQATSLKGLIDKKTREAQDAKKALAEVTAKLRKSEHAAKSATATADKKIIENKEAKKLVSELTTKLRKTEHTAHNFNKANKSASSELQKAKNTTGELTAKLRQNEHRLAELQKMNADLKNKADELRERLKTDFSSLQDKIKTLTEKNQTLAKAYKDQQTQNKA